MRHLEIKARENGPYKISGHFSYIDENGQEQLTPGDNIALCRCGHSARKPFCDGSHRQIDFKAPVLYLNLILDQD